MNRCTGHCCRRFPLPFSPAGLKTALDNTRAGKANWQDIEIIQPMVIPLGPNQLAKAGAWKPPAKQDKGQDEWWDYTCRHLDTATGNCTIYDRRPTMCRTYGSQHPCSTEGCTWEGAMRDIPNTKEAKADDSVLTPECDPKLGTFS